MYKRLKASELLQKLRKISIECSDVEDNEFSDCEGSEPRENEMEISSDNISDISHISDKENESSESEPENILYIDKRRHARVLSNFENVQASQNEIAEGRTRWKRIREGQLLGDYPCTIYSKTHPAPQSMQRDLS